MNKNSEYRIIFYFDKRYNKDRYMIIEGNYKVAIEATKELKNKEFIDNISRYWSIDDMYITHDLTQRLVLKTYLRDAGFRKYWESNSMYHPE